MTTRCLKCSAINSTVGITSRACDGNFLVYPDGREVCGYLPNIGGLCDSDGLSISICIACGHIQGLDLIGLRETFSKSPDEEED